MEILGQRMESLKMDAKGRVLFVLGTRGILTLYWKTGCLFDYTSIYDIGKRLIDDNEAIQNMFLLD